MNKKKMLLLLLLCLFPSIVLANSNSNGFTIVFAIMMEAFVTIHMTAFVLLPLSKMYGGNNSQALFKILFIGRILLLAYFDFFVTPSVAIGDFFAVFIGAFLIVPISSLFCNPVKEKPVRKIDKVANDNKREFEIVRCSYCGKLSRLDFTTCDSCGAAFTEKDILKEWR